MSLINNMTISELAMSFPVETTVGKDGKEYLGAKRGVKAGTVRPRGPVAAAWDLPLLTIAQGQTAGTIWWVGEMPTRDGDVCKCWKRFNFDHLEQSVVDCMSNEELSTLAKALLEEARKINVEKFPSLKFMTLAEDLEKVESMKAKGTSHAAEKQKAKDMKVRNQRKLEGLVDRKSGVIKCDRKKRIQKAVDDAEDKVMKIIKARMAAMA